MSIRTRPLTAAIVSFVLIAWGSYSNSLSAATADREKLKKWNKSQLVDAYEKVGRRDAKWDAAARAMIAAFARQRSSDRTATNDEDDLILLQSKITRKFKCDDPLVLYITARSMEYWHREPETITPYVTQRADAMLASGYHAVYKCRALFRAAEYRMRSKTNVEQSIREARAMAADPDSYDACQLKLHYLKPKWHGSVEEMLAFGRECVAGGNWDAQLPLLLIGAHLEAARYTADGYQPKISPSYFADDRKAYAEMKKVYDQYLARVPQSAYHRSHYAQIAAWAEQWPDAQRQFEAMGDRFSYGYFRNESKYRSLRAEVATICGRCPPDAPGRVRMPRKSALQGKTA